MSLRWCDRAFEELTVRQLHAIYALRVRVFVVEQACAYQEVDEVDLVSRHLWVEDDGGGGAAAGAASGAAAAAAIGDAAAGTAAGDAATGGRILAYLRIIPAGGKHAEASLGRVATAPEARGTGLGRELVRRALALTGGAPLRIGAQAYLERFWTDFGFVRVSDVYDEDGIPHIEMTRAGR